MEHFTDCSVTDCTANHMWGDGVQWQVGNGGTTTDCSFDRIGRQGMTLIGSNLLCDNVDVLHGRRSGFDIEPDSPEQSVGGIEIRNCFTYTLGLPFASGGRGQIDSVFIHHNTSAGNAAPILYCKDSTPAGPLRRSNWRFEDHVSLSEIGTPQPAVFLVAVDGVSIKRNTLPVTTTSLAARRPGRLRRHRADHGQRRAPGGTLYDNETPAVGQVLTVSGNTPALSAQGGGRMASCAT